MNIDKKTLLFSYNPIPTPEYKTVEGSALRFWRMALALQKEGIKDITIAVWRQRPQNYKEYKGIKIASFTEKPDELAELVAGYDTVVFTGAMGGISKDIFDAIGDKTQIIVDAYSPLHVEFLTKSTDKKADAERLKLYKPYVEAFNHCLVGADYLLIANQNQHHLYRGILGGLGALVDHDDSVFINLPAYVEDTTGIEQRKLSKKNQKIEVLWFGGIYPWFDIKNLIQAFADPRVKNIASLTIVGGSNPFYLKDDMRHNGKYIAARELSNKLNLTGSTIKFNDWVEYEERIKVFSVADIAISINSEFLENEYSFRLRVADLVGNALPVITNGGDPLGEELVHKGAAFKIDIGTQKKFVDSLLKVLINRQAIMDAKTRLSTEPLRSELHIYSHIKELANHIELNDRPRLKRLASMEYVNNTKADRVSSSLLKRLDYDTVQFVPTKDLLYVATKRLGRAVHARMRRTIGRRG